jgi:hypothetical protein
MWPSCNTRARPGDFARDFRAILLQFVLRRAVAAALLAAVLALAACQLQPGSENDHPYRNLKSGPNVGGF